MKQISDKVLIKMGFQLFRKRYQMLGNIACLTSGMWVGYDLICKGYLTKEILMLFFLFICIY